MQILQLAESKLVHSSSETIFSRLFETQGKLYNEIFKQELLQKQEIQRSLSHFQEVLKSQLIEIQQKREYYQDIGKNFQELFYKTPKRCKAHWSV